VIYLILVINIIALSLLILKFNKNKNIFLQNNKINEQNKLISSKIESFKNLNYHLIDAKTYEFLKNNSLNTFIKTNLNTKIFFLFIILVSILFDLKKFKKEPNSLLTRSKNELEDHFNTLKQELILKLEEKKFKILEIYKNIEKNQINFSKNFESLSGIIDKNLEMFKKLQENINNNFESLNQLLENLNNTNSFLWIEEFLTKLQTNELLVLELGDVENTDSYKIIILLAQAFNAMSVNNNVMIEKIITLINTQVYTSNTIIGNCVEMLEYSKKNTNQSPEITNCLK